MLEAVGEHRVLVLGGLLAAGKAIALHLDERLEGDRGIGGETPRLGPGAGVERGIDEQLERLAASQVRLRAAAAQQTEFRLRVADRDDSGPTDR